MENKEDNWMPLESNPEVINTYIKDLGFDTSKYALTDVLSTEEWAQESVPQPVKAVIFLYPISEKQEEHRQQENERITKDGQTVASNLFFMEQHADNACGTVAMLHSIVNISHANPDLVSPNSFISNFIEKTKNMNPHERGQFLKGNKELEKAHKEAVQQGQTDAEESVMTHFIAFIHYEGSLYELDGRKEFPINHGSCQEDEVLKKSCEAIQNFMQRDPEEIRFTIMALALAEGF